MLKPYFIILFILLINLSGLAQLPPQKIHRQDFQQVPDEVYQMATHFYDYDASYPLDIRILEKWDDPQGRYRKVSFNSAYGGRIPGELALPLDSTLQAPAVILVHGIGSNKERWYRDDRKSLVDSLLSNGIGVFTLDLNMHGERSYLNDFQNPVFLTFGDSLFVRSRNMFIKSAIDVRRALDFLRSQPYLNAQKLGLVGYSMGAMISSILMALETDIEAVVLCALPTTQQLPMTDPYVFGARAHLPALLLIGQDDWLSSPADIEKLTGILPRGSESIFFDSGHTLPPQFTTTAFNWILKEFR